jgi:trehalose 6-phosphate synthase
MPERALRRAGHRQQCLSRPRCRTLGTFTGASRELPKALLVNPFDVSETAIAMRYAMHMGRDERRERMKLLRRTVKGNNVYRWAGKMLRLW